MLIIVASLSARAAMYCDFVSFGIVSVIVAIFSLSQFGALSVSSVVLIIVASLSPRAAMYCDFVSFGVVSIIVPIFSLSQFGALYVSSVALVIVVSLTIGLIPLLMLSDFAGAVSF